MLGELKLCLQDWTSITAIITSVLIEADHERLCKNADGSSSSSLQVMTVILPRSAIIQVMTGQTSTRGALMEIERTEAERIAQVTTLQKSLNNVYKNVAMRIDIRRQRAIDAQKTATNIITPNFFAEDFFLVFKATRPNHKLSFRWSGPRKLVAVTSSAVCVVEDLSIRKKETIHVTRMKKCDGLIDGQDVPEDVLDPANLTAAKYKVMSKIVDMEHNDDGYWLRLEWDSLPERYFTWARIEDMHEDIPVMVVDYLRATKKK